MPIPFYKYNLKVDTISQKKLPKKEKFNTIPRTNTIKKSNCYCRKKTNKQKNVINTPQKTSKIRKRYHLKVAVYNRAGKDPYRGSQVSRRSECHGNYDGMGGDQEIHPRKEGIRTKTWVRRQQATVDKRHAVNIDSVL